jgi:phosphate transport system substrate-binding protein
MPTRLLAVVAAAATVASLAACGTETPHSGGAPRSSPTTTGVGNPASPVTVTETGSTLMLPYLQQVVAPLRQAYPNIILQPSGGGSGGGIAGALSGTVDLGGSDAYLSDLQQQANLDILDLPVAVSAQAIDYNLPGIAGLRLDGDVLARIYRGEVTTWNDRAISALNPGLTLPATRVVPVRRAERSGDTFMFTQFLSNAVDSWRTAPGYGATIDWPGVAVERTARGNSGMVSTCAAVPGCVAYVGVSAQRAAAGGSSPEHLAPVSFVALPDMVRARVQAAIRKITAGVAG